MGACAAGKVQSPPGPLPTLVKEQVELKWGTSLDSRQLFGHNLAREVSPVATVTGVCHLVTSRKRGKCPFLIRNKVKVYRRQLGEG